MSSSPLENGTRSADGICASRLPGHSLAPLFVTSDIYRRAAYGGNHPLAIPRVETAVDLCTDLGWLPDGTLVRSPVAGIDRLTRFHHPDYVAALERCDGAGHVTRSDRVRYNIGTMENPLFDGVFRRASTSVGGSIHAAELSLSGRVAYHPAGGTHHGRPDRASGFCYFNDPVFAVLTYLDHGLERVLYVDLDAHHGDAVETAFADEPRVHTLSIHETGRWPHTGGLDDRGGGRSWNLPVPRGFNDSELHYCMHQLALPLCHAAKPQALVITCGADGLTGDPLSAMALSNVALWDAVIALSATAPAVTVVGGGGYNPWTVARCWAGLWGRLAGFEMPKCLPQAALARLRGLTCDLIDEEDIDPAWLTTLADAPAPGPVRQQVRDAVQQLCHRGL